jgi:hypothetical protein
MSTPLGGVDPGVLPPTERERPVVWRRDKIVIHLVWALVVVTVLAVGVMAFGVFFVLKALERVMDRLTLLGYPQQP